MLLVLDVSKPLTSQEHELIAMLPAEKAIAVWNKSDLGFGMLEEVSLPNVVLVSAKEKTGLDLLRYTIDRVIWEHGPPSREEVLITNVRHKEALANAIEACHQLIRGLKDEVSPEFLAADMRHCLGQLGRIIGSDVTEDILSAIFSKFCVGK